MPADDAYDVSMTQHGSYRRISYSSAVRIVAYDGCSSVILPNAGAHEFFRSFLGVTSPVSDAR